MTDRDDDVLKELDAALQVEPSRAFADGVRARVTRSRTNTQRIWWGLAAAASVGLATMTMWRPAVETPAVADSAVAAPTQMATGTAPNVAPAHGIPADKAKPVVVRRKAPVATLALGGTAEPRLEVITNQGAVLREIWAAYQGRPLVAAESEHAVQSGPSAPIVVEPIVVAPIVVSEIGRVPGSAGGVPIVRRIDATKETR